MGTMTSIRHSTSKSGSEDGEALVVEVDASVGTDADLVRPKTMDGSCVERYLLRVLSVDLPAAFPRSSSRSM